MKRKKSFAIEPPEDIIRTASASLRVHIETAFWEGFRAAAENAWPKTAARTQKRGTYSRKSTKSKGRH